MIPAAQHGRMCLFINLMAAFALYNGHYESAAILMYAGLVQFQTHLVAKKYEEREIELDKENKLKDTWVKHHQESARISLMKQHELEDRITELKKKEVR